MIGVTAPTPLDLRASRRRIEPLWVTLIKLALYAFAITLYLLPFSSWPGIGAAMGMAFAGILAADAAYRRRLRVIVALLAAPTLVLLAGSLGDRLLDWAALARALGIEDTFLVADVVTFGLGAGAVVFLLRILSNRLRTLSILEVLFVAGSVAMTLADHRNRMLNRPRYLSDWAWSLGIDPTTILVGVGIVAILASAILFLREERFFKVLISFLLLFAVGALFYLWGDKHIEAKVAADSLGLSGKGGGKDQGKNGKKGKGKRKGKGGGGGGQSDNPFKNNYDPPPPRPVAIAILRDDYEPPDGVMYFRQRVLSKYNGVSLTADPEADTDVPTSFGDAHDVKVATTQNVDQHVEVPTTMYLLVDHPQPPALTHAIRLALVPNPNPQHFVAAYDVRSLVLAVSPRRLLGRRSIPSSWRPSRAKHYTEIPDDPRYRTLADIIVHKLDPRFADDDLAKAFAVKRYLEKHGFYTRKSKHASKKDPTASFLFGNLRGYCVHFAHAGVYLFRSLGIASRVALGYAVQTRKRSGGSSILIMGDRAHAWPEIYLDGVGWVTFDIYPERTDLPPSAPVDYDLEKLLGELARKDPTGGVAPTGKPWEIPWMAMAYLLGLALLAFVALGYLVKAFRAILPGIVGMSRYPRFAYLAALDSLSEVGGARRRGESREGHARRLADLAPSLSELTRGHLARAFDSPTAPDAGEFREMIVRLRQDLRAHVSWRQRLLGRLNPYSWLWTR